MLKQVCEGNCAWLLSDAPEVPDAAAQCNFQGVTAQVLVEYMCQFVVCSYSQELLWVPMAGNYFLTRRRHRLTGSPLLHAIPTSGLDVIGRRVFSTSKKGAPHVQCNLENPESRRGGLR